MLFIEKLPTKIISIILTFICFISLISGYSGIIQAAGNPAVVDAIDSVVITEMYDTDKIMAEWESYEPDITVHRAFKSAEAVKLFINWSDSSGSIELHEGDYFTFVIPGVFDHGKITNVNNKEITNSDGEIVANYSIYTNAQGVKEIKVTFTTFVDTHTDISGDLWLVLYVGSVGSSEIKSLEYGINGEVVAQGDLTVNPEQVPTLAHPISLKYGYGSPTKVVNGYYIFEWNVYLNMDENSKDSGFNTLVDYFFEDIIPPDSPHVFITSEIAVDFNIPSSYQGISIKEYTGSDLEPPTERYQTFLKRYYNIDGDHWANYFSQRMLAEGVTTTGIDGNNGMNISGVKITDKLISAKLGTLTRPTVIHYYTIATIKISEGSLGDSETVKFFKNTFIGSDNGNLNAKLSEYYFASGGSAKGIQGEYSFTFSKVSESGIALLGALFSLYTNENCTGGADRVASVDINGMVTFNNLAAGTYYFQETIAPEGYLLDNSTYKVEINDKGFEIYYGDDFENKLDDQGNRIINKLESKNTETVYVTFNGTKTLSGKTLEDGMFNYAVKDTGGNTVDICTNDADGKITFNAMSYTAEGSYLYTVAEVHGNEAGFEYSDTEYSVAVTIFENGDGMLTATVEYPDGEIQFRNNYVVKDTGGVRLTKYNDDKSIKLSNATFKLYLEDGTFLNTYITNKDGIIEIEGLDYGSLYFVESNPPEGYEPSIGKIQFTLNDETTQNGVVHAEIEVTNKELTKGMETGLTNDDLDPESETGRTKTGDEANPWIWITMLSFATVIITISLLTILKHRNRNTK